MKHAVSIRLAFALGFYRTIESNVRYKPRPAVAGLPHPLAWVRAPSPALPDPLPPEPRLPSKNTTPRNRFGRRPIVPPTPALAARRVHQLPIPQTPPPARHLRPKFLRCDTSSAPGSARDAESH
jgi:hypothetical protein